MPAERGRRLVAGWGNTAPTAADVVAPQSRRELADLLVTPPRRGLIARGLGRSYGDVAQNAGGVVADCTALDRVVGFDGESGVVTVEGGASIDTLLRTFVPLGWFVPVTPGTRYVTVAGCVANDVHGKNHHVDGSFADHVVSLLLQLPDGEVVEIGPERRPDLYWATVGGLGLTGLIVEVTLRLLPVRTSLVRVDRERASDLDDLMARMAGGDHRYRYSVAWIDLLASGRALGRAVLTRGDHAEPSDLPARAARHPLAFSPRSPLPTPPVVPPHLLNRWSIKAFNELWFRKGNDRPEGLETIGAFFHPLDGVAAWNRLYGPQGFLQYQFVLPPGEEATLRAIVERLACERVASFLAVLKRFGDGNAGLLSFPMKGWTLALDVPAGGSGLDALLDQLDGVVADAGGRVYLAKDARLAPELMPVMYPRLERWRQIRAEVDPAGILMSDLARRLGL
ncbi:MAG TPA: FAD-binding oxidoreductase [Acidimicrobiales bacterium]|nr:FAD-binding oxidoreductase [Acidimicrobiales bacterium]